MSKKRSWADEQLREAVVASTSYRQTLIMIGLEAKGGNYEGIKRHIERLQLDTSHFTGRGWNAGWAFDPRVKSKDLHQLLVKDGNTQSHKLKKKLFSLNIKKPMCEICGWAQKSPDGRIPVELDHINGDHTDNRLENLRILCPNCHALQPTHRGRNKKKRYARVL